MPDKIPPDHKFTQQDYNRTKPQLGLEFCKDCKQHKPHAEMMTPDLCLKCAADVLKGV